MRVTMVQTAAGLKPPSGGYRGNYATLLALQKYGHVTMQFCWAFEKDIYHAIAELKSSRKLSPDNFKTGTTYMLNSKLEEVLVTWYKFTNSHDIVCICLDAKVMIETYPNNLQQEDAAIMIEVSAFTIVTNFTDFMRLVKHLLEQFRMSSG